MSKSEEEIRKEFEETRFYPNLEMFFVHHYAKRLMEVLDDPRMNDYDENGVPYWENGHDVD